MKYTGEGSFDNPAFPLRFNHACGSATICHNRSDLGNAFKHESYMNKFGFAAALALMVPVSGFVFLAAWLVT